MTSATGQPNTRLRCPAGFTLIELILVLTLLAIAASFIAPAQSGFFRGRALAEEASRLLSLSRAAQSRAVSEGLPVRLWLDAAQGAYGLEEESRAGADPQALQFALNDNVQLTVPRAGAATAPGHQLPAIRFLPDGSVDEASPAAVRLTDSSGAVLWFVQTRNRLGYELQRTNP